MSFFDRLKPKVKPKVKLKVKLEANPIQEHATQTVADIAFIMDGISQEQTFLAKYKCPIKTDHGYFSHQEINNGVSCAGHVVANLFNIRESGQHNGYKYYLEMLRVQDKDPQKYSTHLKNMIERENIGFSETEFAIKGSILLPYLKQKDRSVRDNETYIFSKQTYPSLSINVRAESITKKLFGENNSKPLDALLCVSSDHYYGYVKNTKGQRYYIDSMSQVGAILISPQEIAQELAENIYNGTVLTIFPLTYEDKSANIEFHFDK